MGNQRHANDTEGHYPPGLERCWWSDRRPMSHYQIVHYQQEDVVQAFHKASHRGPEHCYLSEATCLGDIACTPLQTTVSLWPSAGSSDLGEAISALSKRKHFTKHRIKDLSIVTYRKPHVWEISHARRYKPPFLSLTIRREQ